MHAQRAWVYLAFAILGAASLIARHLSTHAIAQPETQDRSGVILEVNGPIGPAVADYLVRELDRAAEAERALVVIEMDTPGGLDQSMRAMIQAILASPVPVATYVSPSGARAASAGLYIMYASHIAAMAPGTNAGAATPVQLGAPPESEPDADRGIQDIINPQPPEDGEATDGEHINDR